ncbi:unnamed protein product [Paramecium pentaurelia]|uniref:Uncharacterized protein n=1 Tax=Paramecium pentaurelia TaxID=43138 RepID=A0A8S1VRC0_9CILI|nr:unnamed protein product [Paramecium pentaurelia]
MLKPKMIENQKDFRCSKGHNLPVTTIALDPKLSREQRLLCTECLDDADLDTKVVGLKKIILLIEENQVNKMETVENIIMNQIKLIESLHGIVDQMKSFVIQQLNQLITILMDWIQNLKQQGSQDSQYSFYEELEIMFIKQNKTDDYLQIIIKEIQQTNLCWTSKFNHKLEKFQQFEQYNKCKELLSCLLQGTWNFNQSEQKQQIDIQQKNKEIEFLHSKLNIKESETIQSTHPIYLKPFNYQIIQQTSFSQFDLCLAIAIDNDCSTLVAGCREKIKVYEFKQGIIDEIQTLNEHKDRICTLNFMKKSKQFISGSCDNTIRIWKQNQNNLWSSLQVLNGHSNTITCLVFNLNEDLIISGSHDSNIKFWMKKNEWLLQQTITDHSNYVYGLSLNQEQNRIVSCGYDKFILIIENQGQNTEWKVIQKINIDNCGWRVCFIDNNLFTLSQRDQEYISVFEINTINKQFTKTRDITIKCGSDTNCLFPQQYINSKCILLSKNGEYVNLIRKKQNGEFLTEQSIHFGSNSLYGGMSEDGQYLITWDSKSYQIQIRKYQEL